MDKKKISRIILTVGIVVGIIVVAICVINNIKKYKNYTPPTMNEVYIYEPTDNEKKILEKRYDEMNFDGKRAFEEIEKKYDSMTEKERQNIDHDVSRLRFEREQHKNLVGMQNEANMKECEELIAELESEYGIEVSAISGEKEERTLFIKMKLLENIDSTEYKCAEITCQKETRMKEFNIKEIQIDIKNSKDELKGTLGFDLIGGRYEPVSNTLGFFD